MSQYTRIDMQYVFNQVEPFDHADYWRCALLTMAFLATMIVGMVGIGFMTIESAVVPIAVNAAWILMLSYYMQKSAQLQRTIDMHKRQYELLIVPVLDMVNERQEKMVESMKGTYIVSTDEGGYAVNNNKGGFTVPRTVSSDDNELSDCDMRMKAIGKMEALESEKAYWLDWLEKNSPGHNYKDVFTDPFTPEGKG